jgi:hypothetical protein
LPTIPRTPFVPKSLGINRSEDGSAISAAACSRPVVYD